MDEAADRSRPNRGSSAEENSRRYELDARSSSGVPDEESSNNSGSRVSVGNGSTRLANLSASFRIFSESLLRKELAELEMIKSREALRCEAEKKRMESEAELTQKMAQTQLQIASFVAAMNSSRKRKRAEEDESTGPQREGALLLGLLQCNLIL